MEENNLKTLVETEQRSKSNSHRIDNLEEKVEDIHELATSTKLLASETKAMREDINDMLKRVKQLEDKPVREYEETRKQVKSHVISYICNIVLAALAIRIRIIKIFIKYREGE